MKILRFILGDQLNPQHSWFDKIDSQVSYVMMEVLQETSYVQHHIQKVVAFFAAMRNFAEEKQKQGHSFIYLKLDNESNLQSIPKNLSFLIHQYHIEKFEYQLPDEYRLDVQLLEFCKSLSIPYESFDSEHFLTTRLEMKHFFAGKKTYLMESFYRYMRKKHQLLMENGEPIGGKWNFDSENRKKFDRKIPVPNPPIFENEVEEIYQTIQKMNVKTIGNIDLDNFEWAVTRQQGLVLLDFFLKNCLKYFGTYQDAMDTHFPYLFHSRLSFVMNVKLLSPLEVVRASLDYWQEHDSEINIAQIEGFLRQIIGWREYMRGAYWANMPQFAQLNFFEHQNSLPDFYWTGKTKMNCLSHAINQSLNHAYAHHIQRLMITGSFASLAGVHPDWVDEWYLGIYIDAIEWVEITNTRGMSQFADGGLVATKPYVGSANYIHKMTNYCTQCHYNKDLKYGEKACPFNSMYWHFYDRNKSKLEKNPRIGMMYNLLNNMDSKELDKILKQAEIYLSAINDL
ncbi:MAG: cryptochrome/photolyase family protein [Thermoflexibacter sp.]|nr:cryptochrome/photolyase family protein [Thermoflexibacter sp.]